MLDGWGWINAMDNRSRGMLDEWGWIKIMNNQSRGMLAGWGWIKTMLIVWDRKQNEFLIIWIF